MKQRIHFQKTEPAAYAAMFELEKYLGTTKLTNTQKELIKIRASQINGCAFCLDMHTKDARKYGETEQRIYLLNAWKETTLFTEEEKALLALTEEITLITKGVSDETYQNAAKFFDEQTLAQIITAIITINGWNRMAVATHLQPAGL